MNNLELHTEPVRFDYDKRTGRFLKGRKTWNKGMTWDEMGIGKRKQKKILKCLTREGRKDIGGWNKRPVIGIFPDGHFQYYPSAAQASRENNLCQRNITNNCQKKRKSCGGIMWFYEEEKEWVQFAPNVYKMKVNKDYVVRYVADDKYCETKEERDVLYRALMAAMAWGRKIDRENAKVRRQNDAKGVTFKA